MTRTSIDVPAFFYLQNSWLGDVFQKSGAYFTFLARRSGRWRKWGNPRGKHRRVLFRGLKDRVWSLCMWPALKRFSLSPYGLPPKPCLRQRQPKANIGKSRRKRGRCSMLWWFLRMLWCHQHWHRFTVDQKWPEWTWQSWASKCQAKCTSERWQVRRKDFIKIIVCWASAWQVQCCGTPQVFEFWCQKGLASPLFSAGRGAKPTQCILILELFIYVYLVMFYFPLWS